MIYFNNTTCKVYFYGNVIDFYSIFNHCFVDIYKLNVNDNIKFILSKVFVLAKSSNDTVYYEDCKKFIDIKFTHLVGKGNIIINNNIISIEEFNKKYLNMTFNKSDLIIINNDIEYHEIVT